MKKTRMFALAIVMSLGIVFTVGAANAPGYSIAKDPEYGDID
ncbi:hypothetical protein WMZ97_06435 [Lentibacillus sp. N15]